MAVIYETEKDLRQKTLDDQAKGLHKKANAEASTGMLGVGLGLIADNYNLRKEVPSRGLAWFGTIISLVGIIESVKSLVTSRDAHKVERQLQLEGPMVSVLPPATTTAIFGQDFNHVADKNFAQNIQPKSITSIQQQTLLEHIQSTDGGEKSL